MTTSRSMLVSLASWFVQVNRSPQTKRLIQYYIAVLYCFGSEPSHFNHLVFIKFVNKSIEKLQLIGGKLNPPGTYLEKKWRCRASVNWKKNNNFPHGESVNSVEATTTHVKLKMAHNFFFAHRLQRCSAAVALWCHLLWTLYYKNSHGEA